MSGALFCQTQCAQERIDSPAKQPAVIITMKAARTQFRIGNKRPPSVLVSVGCDTSPIGAKSRMLPCTVLTGALSRLSKRSAATEGEEGRRDK